MSIAFHPNQTVTPEELEHISREYSHMRFERGSGGKLIVAPPPGTLGSFGESELHFQVIAWARRDGTGRATAPDGGFTFPDGSILAPDTAWLSHERWKALSKEERKGYAHLAPDVVFELLSPGDTLARTRTKAATYLRNGVRLVVLIDPSSRLAELHRPDAPAASHLGADTVTIGPEMPGFVLDLAAILASMEGE